MSSVSESQQSLEHTLRQYRRLIRRAVWLNGLGRFLTALVMSVLFAGLLDACFHWESAAFRLAVSGLIGIAIGRLAWKRLIKPTFVELPDDRLALELEKHVPEADGILSSAVQFRRAQNSPTLGSPELQRAVTSSANSLIANIDVRTLIDHRPVVRWVALASLALVVGASTAAWQPKSAEVALTRLVKPTAETAWPQLDRLALLDSELEPVISGESSTLAVAEGSRLRFFVSNGQRKLPDDLRAEIRLADGSLVDRAVQMVVRISDLGRQETLGELTLGRIREPFEVRVAGGDDESMPWLSVRVLKPPQLDEIAVIVTPPVYAGLPERQLPAGTGDLTTLVGSSVAIRGRSTLPLESVGILVHGQPVADVELAPDGRTFRASFTVSDPGQYPYSFRFKGRDGVSPPEMPGFYITAAADLPPDVRLMFPEGDLLLTERAVLPVRVSAEDDVGVDAVLLRLRVEGAIVDLPLAASGRRNAGRQMYGARLDLTRFNLIDGNSVEFEALADDAASHLPDRPAISETRRIEIVSSEKKISELESRERQLKIELARFGEHQKRGLSVMEDLLVQVQTANELRVGDVDQLRFVDQQVAQLRHEIAGNRGVLRELRRMRDEMGYCRLGQIDLGQRISALESSLSGLLSDHILPLQQALQEAARLGELMQYSKAATQPDSQDFKAEVRAVELVQAVGLAGQHERSVIEIIGRLTQGLERSVSLRDLRKSLGELVQSQTGLANESRNVLEQTIALTTAELTTQTQANLARLAVRQLRLAEQLTEWSETLIKMTEQPEWDALSADRMSRTLQSLRHQATDRLMSQTAESIRSNQAGTAISRHREIIEQLRHLQSLLEDTNPDDAESRFSELQAIRGELQFLLELVARMADEGVDDTSRQERASQLRRVQDRLRLVASRLEAAQLTESQQAVRAAADLAGSIWKNVLAGRDKDYKLQMTGLIASIGIARQSVEGALRDAETDVLAERLRTLVKQVDALAIAQQKMNLETRTLAAQHASSDRWTRSQLREMGRLSKTQGTLADELRKASRAIQSLPAVLVMLQSAEASMVNAAAALKRREIGPSVQTLQAQALDQLTLLRESIIIPRNDLPSTDAENEDAGDQETQNGTMRFSRMQMRLIVRWQEQINQKTIELGQPVVVSPELQFAALEGLAGEQRRLESAFRSLIAPAGAAAVPAAVESLLDDLVAVAGRLDARNTGAETRALQESVLLRLKQFVREVERRPEVRPADNGTSTEGMQDPSNGTSEPAEQQPGGGGTEGAAGDAGSEAGQPSGTQGEGPEQALLNQRRELVEGVWGHLPAEIQAEILNVTGQRSLPQYSREISDYFESLSSVRRPENDDE